MINICLSKTTFELARKYALFKNRQKLFTVDQYINVGTTVLVIK
jgi:hypothetical protein